MRYCRLFRQKKIMLWYACLLSSLAQHTYLQVPSIAEDVGVRPGQACQEHSGRHHDRVQILLLCHVHQLGEDGLVRVQFAHGPQSLLPGKGRSRGAAWWGHHGRVHGLYEVLEHLACFPFWLRLAFWKMNCFLLIYIIYLSVFLSIFLSLYI